MLVHEIQRVRAAPLSIQIYDEASSAAVREQCLTLCDVRAVLIEVVCRLDQLQNCQRMSLAKQQVLALQVCATRFLKAPNSWRPVSHGPCDTHCKCVQCSP